MSTSAPRAEGFKKQVEDLLGPQGLSPHSLPPQQLYHYTNAQALLGILDAQEPSIWATHYLHLNDTSEVALAHRMLMQVMTDRASSASAFAGDVLRGLVGLDGGLLALVDVYVACFCECDDLLGQWRAYGGRDGAYSIGLRPYTPFTSRIGRHYTLHKVIYEEPEQISILSAIVDLLCSAIDELPDAEKDAGIRNPIILTDMSDSVYRVTFNAEPDLSGLLAAFTSPILSICGCFKNKAFQQEAEYRLLHVVPRHVELPHRDAAFRSANGVIVPYVPLPLQLRNCRSRSEAGNFDLISIRHGPGLQNSRRGLELLVARHYGGTPCVIDGSTITVRL